MLRTLPSALLLQFLIGPVLLHLLLRQAKTTASLTTHIPVDEAADEFAAAFVRAMSSIHIEDLPDRLRKD
jgi:hypothetical protein